jgi:hypothetical protein
MEQRGELPNTPVSRADVQVQGSIDEANSEASRNGTSWIENKSILTPTSGFLGDGYSHTLNPYVGCSNAGSVCGIFCYAQHQFYITKNRPWGLYGAKRIHTTFHLEPGVRAELLRLASEQGLSFSETVNVACRYYAAATIERQQDAGGHR